MTQKPKGSLSWDEQKKKMKKVEDGDLFKFDEIGKHLMGTLKSKGTSSRFGMGIYELEDTEGATHRFCGTAMLDRKLQSFKVGDVIAIEFIDEQATDKGNPLKIFDVYSA